ncbi:2-phospho-L-lactate transferase CofD family protein [Desulfurivibrio sp. D14AmB]|uniref:gluconeogenesis factor YvcK family protein n=1 Tax=Desulfurivibrio sp. D14AmB TaxID=3374370 RepID=UPI00376EC1F1
MPTNEAQVAAESERLQATLGALQAGCFRPLDLLPYQGTTEKLLALALNGPPAGPAPITEGLAELAAALEGVDTSQARVLVFGGGTGLSNIIGGDSRHPRWPENPFAGLKALFPRTSAVVCVTDDGGSTGELLKDLPLIAVGDLRHVLLSSIRLDKLTKQYELNESEATQVVGRLHRLFNFRFPRLPVDGATLLAQCGVDLALLPPFMARSLGGLIAELFEHGGLRRLGQRPHCLGNLLLVAAIYRQPGVQPWSAEPVAPPPAAIRQGLRFLADLLGASPEAVLPCTTTPASLKILYENGVLVSGESKSATARRRCPVDRVFVEFAHPPEVAPELLAAVAEADIILFAPGSLFTSIIPILQLPGLAAAVRQNRRALKVLLANLWVQAGETDLVRGERERRFHVSDLLRAYRRNIPGGFAGLFRQVLVVGMREIPGSILQSYALENKIPIYLDREQVQALGLTPLEAAIASQHTLDGRGVIQHDPAAVACAARVLWALRDPAADGQGEEEGEPQGEILALVNPQRQTPDRRLAELEARLVELDLTETWRPVVANILWNHRDIRLEHLAQVAGLRLISVADWSRCQEWDNVFSFYDPQDRMIKIRADVAQPAAPGAGPGPRFEIAFLVALGQSLLGNYAAVKEKTPVVFKRETVGYIFSLTMREEPARHSFFTGQELAEYLRLARMRPSAANPLLFTRLLNSQEGFTPPGLLFGLTYAWYLDNRFAPHIEYKMSIARAESSDLVPEQQRIAGRRQGLIDFFRSRVFRQQQVGC